MKGSSYACSRRNNRSNSRANNRRAMPAPSWLVSQTASVYEAAEEDKQRVAASEDRGHYNQNANVSSRTKIDNRIVVNARSGYNIPQTAPRRAGSQSSVGHGLPHLTS